MKPNTVASDLRALTNERDALRTRVAQLEAIVAKLPTTADGVPVVPGEHVYRECYKCAKGWRESDIWAFSVLPMSHCARTNHQDRLYYYLVSDCYSTRAAAEAAAGSVGIGTTNSKPIAEADDGAGGSK